MSFIDDHTQLTRVFLLKEKYKVGQVFKNFNVMIQTQFKTEIQILWMDNAKEAF